MYVKEKVSNSQSFSQNYFVVTYCDDVATKLGYLDPNCETDHTKTDEMMYDYYASFGTKAVAKYFD